MGWPKKNEQMRIYKDRGDNGYMIVDISDERRWGLLDAIVNTYEGPSPTLTGSMVSTNYIYTNWLKRTQWDELPQEWQDRVMEYMERGREEGEEKFDPRTVRGFWRVGKQPIEITKRYT